MNNVRAHDTGLYTHTHTHTHSNETHSLAWTMVLQERYLWNWAWLIPYTLTQTKVPPMVRVQKVCLLRGFRSKLHRMETEREEDEEGVEILAD